MLPAERESRYTENRLILLQWGTAAIFLLLLSGFWRLQVLQPDYYTRLAEQNYIKNIPIPAPRGRILDRNGQVLVDNYPSFSIIAQWDYEEELQEHLTVISEGLRTTPEDLTAQIESSRKKSPYGPIVLRENSSRQDVAFIESHRREFPELDLVTVPRRLYLPDGFGAHMLGYVGEVSEAELQRPEWSTIRAGGVVGKSGLERQYDDILRGQDAARRVVVDHLGREAAVLDEEVPAPGTDLRLTLDYDLQAIAEAAFQGDQGALVALDPRTGAVLAMVSRPAFDPNLFATGIRHEDWSKLITDRSNPLLNRAIQAQLAPGSIYKVLLAAAGLEAGTADSSTTFFCPGSASFYGRTFRCWQTRGHGRVNVHQALVHSCDVFFYNLGRELGIDGMADFSTQFGLGRKTGIDLPNEESGTMPSPEWKERRFRQKWYAGETISVAIGQGAMTTTPIQLAYSIGGIASGGRFVRPKLILPEELASHKRAVPQQDIIQVPLSDETVKLVTDALYGVVNEGGTGGRARVPNLDIGGKTGTAQVASLQATRGGGTELRDNAWFVGLAPRRNPEIIVAVLYQSGEHGYLAAPLARDVIKAYFDKKQGIQPQLSKELGPDRTVAEAPAASASGG